jgi:hypothetical protein
MVLCRLTESLNSDRHILMLNLQLNPEEIEVLMQQDPASESGGGYQKLLVTLQYLLDPATGTIETPDVLLERIPRYAFDYGNGGWENRLVAIFGRTLGPNLGR